MLRRGLPLVDPVSCSLVTDDSPARADLRRPKVLGASGPSCDPRSSAKAAKPLRPNNHIVERRASPSSTRMSSESKNLLKTTDAYPAGEGSPAVCFAQPPPLAWRLPGDRPKSPFPDRLCCLPVPTNRSPSDGRSGLESGRNKHCLGCPQDLLALSQGC